MKLISINRNSATFFGVIVLAFTFLRGFIMWYVSNYAPEFAVQYGIPGGLEFLQIAIVIPLVTALVYYAAMLLLIVVYNNVAKKHPITWEVTK